MSRVRADRAIRTYPAIWAIAIVATVAIAAASGSCVFGTATNLCESGRRCDPGQTCAAKQDICVDIDGCGNGRLDPGEACDDGNIIAGDGCSPDCQSNETCGNGILDTGADPNNPKETCDDGNTQPGDGCSDKCLDEVCGDGIYDPLNNEECDTAGDTQVCNGHGLCTVPRCGDGYMNPMFTPQGADSPEECDDGNETNSDFCLDGSGGNCRIARCGDGFIRTVSDPDHPAEECDDGNQNNTDSCPDGPGGTCKAAFCGDGFIHSGVEECDTGPTHTDTSTCDGIDCTRPICGDGHVNTAAGEICDPGDATHPGDTHLCPIGTVCVATGTNACKACI